MPKLPLLFFIRTSLTNYYTVSDAGAVSTQSTAKPVRWMPDSDDKMELTWHRDMNHFGIVGQFAAPTRWYGDAAMILRHVVATEGLEFKLQLEVRRLDTTTQTYSVLNVMDFDFSTFRTEELYVTCGCIQGGLYRLVKSRMNTNYEIPIEAPSYETINIDGMHALTKYNFVGAVANFESFIVNSSWAGGMQYWPLNFTTKEGEIEVGNPQYVIVNNIADEPKDNYIYKALYDQDVVLKLDGGIIYSVPNSFVEGRLVVWVVKSTVSDYNVVSVQTAVYEDAMQPGGSSNMYRAINITHNMSLATGDIVVVTYGIERGGGAWINSNNAYVYPDAQMSIKATFRLSTTQSKAYRFRHYMQKLVQKLTDNLYNFSSNYFTLPWGGTTGPVQNYMNNPMNTAITSGNAIRGLADNAIVGSLQNAVRNAQAIGMVGMGIEGNNVIIENLKKFFQPNVTIADVGVVQNFVISPATDLLVSNVMFGYPEADVNEINGKYAYNNTSEFTTPLTLVNDTLELTATANAEPYGIEVLRSRTFNKDTKDTAGDKSAYLLTFTTTSPTNGAWNLYRPNGTKVGVLFPNDIYNYDITPKLNMFRWGAYLRSLFFQQQTQKIKFITASKNKELQMLLQGGLSVITEKADEFINSLDAPFFKPYYFEFDCQTPNDLYTQMTGNPYGIIKFKVALTKQGQNVINPVLVDAQGYIVELNVRVDRPDLCSVKLLCTASVNLDSILKYGNIVGSYPQT